MAAGNTRPNLQTGAARRHSLDQKVRLWICAHESKIRLKPMSFLRPKPAPPPSRESDIETKLDGLGLNHEMNLGGIDSPRGGELQTYLKQSVTVCFGFLGQFASPTALQQLDNDDLTAV